MNNEIGINFAVGVAELEQVGGRLAHLTKENAVGGFVVVAFANSVTFNDL